MNWIIQKFKDRSERARLEALVDEAREILAPHFELDEAGLYKLKAPSVKIFGESSYNPELNRIYLTRGIQKKDFNIGKQVSYWFHKHINEKTFSKSHIRDYLNNFVSNWGGIIYAGRLNEFLEARDTVIEPTLGKLVRMTIEEAKNLPNFMKHHIYLSEFIEDFESKRKIASMRRGIYEQYER